MVWGSKLKLGLLDSWVESGNVQKPDKSCDPPSKLCNGTIDVSSEQISTELLLPVKGPGLTVMLVDEKPEFEQPLASVIEVIFRFVEIVGQIFKGKFVSKSLPAEFKFTLTGLGLV